MGTSYFLEGTDCRLIFETVEERIEQFIKQRERQAFHIVVIDPAIPVWEVDRIQRSQRIPDVILWEATVGTIPEGALFVRNARLKALKTAILKRTLSEVWEETPAVLGKGDIAWKGGIYHKGVAAGGSGLIETDDEIALRMFLEPLLAHVQKQATWPTPEKRIQDIGGWGGLLPNKSRY